MSRFWRLRLAGCGVLWASVAVTYLLGPVGLLVTVAGAFVFCCSELERDR